MFNLAGIFWEGRGTQQDFSRAVHWWQQAAAHDDSASQYNLGLAYFLGQGVTSNPAQAIAWLQKANRNGYPGAQSALELVKDALSETSPNEIISREAESVISPESTSAVPMGTSDLAQATIIPTNTSEIVSPTMQRAERVAPTAITPTASATNDTPTIANAVTPAGVPRLTASENEAPTSSPADAITATALTEPAKVLLIPVTVEETHLTQTAQATSAQAAIITGEAVQAYATRAGLLPVLGTLMPDMPIKILSVTDEWTQVLIPGGIDVWVFDQFIAEDDQGARIQGEGVRARSVPSTGADSKVIGYFSHGDTVTVQSVQGQWKLVTPSAIPLAVWIMSEHVQLLETVNPAWLSAWATPVTVEETHLTQTAQATSAQAAIITGEAVQAYATRAGLLPVLGTLMPDMPIKILSVTDEWTQVLIPGGIDVWVFDQFIAEDDQGARIQGEGVRARSVPSTGADSKVIGYFSHGDTVTVQSVQGQWKLVTPSAIPLAVWIMSEHVQLLETVSPLHKTLPIDTTRSDQNTDTDTVPENMSTTERLTTETSVEMTVHAKAPSAVDSPLEPALDPPTSFRAGIVNVAVGDLFGVSRPGARPLEPVINGTAVKILLERGDWAHVKTAGGLSVWVHSDFVTAHQGTYTIRADGVNAWSSPPPRDVDEEHLLTFQQGDEISIISRQGEWTRLRALNSVAGWMRRDQLDILDTVTAEWTEKWSRARASIRQ